MTRQTVSSEVGIFYPLGSTYFLLFCHAERSDTKGIKQEESKPSRSSVSLRPLIYLTIGATRLALLLPRLALTKPHAAYFNGENCCCREAITLADNRAEWWSSEAQST